MTFVDYVQFALIGLLAIAGLVTWMEIAEMREVRRENRSDSDIEGIMRQYGHNDASDPKQ